MTLTRLEVSFKFKHQTIQRHYYHKIMPRWPRRPSARWPDAKAEEEYECLKCKDWKPWFCYHKTFSFLFCFGGSQNVDRKGVYDGWLAFHEDPVASQCHRFACDFCTEKALQDSGVWTITPK